MINFLDIFVKLKEVFFKLYGNEVYFIKVQRKIKEFLKILYNIEIVLFMRIFSFLCWLKFDEDGFK